MGMILRIASSRIVGQGDIVGRSGYFSLNLSANSVMRGRLDARRTLKSLVADLRVKMTVVNLMMNSVPGEVAWMNTLTMQHWRSYHIDLQLIAGVWLPILKITEAGDTSFIRKLENAMEDNSELKRSIQSNARATQLTFDF